MKSFTKASRLAWHLLQSREIHGPVGLPTVALVEREGLLPARRLRRDVRPQETDADLAPVVLVVAIESADALVEAADHRRKEDAGPTAVEPEDRPAIPIGIVGT